MATKRWQLGFLTALAPLRQVQSTRGSATRSPVQRQAAKAVGAQQGLEGPQAAATAQSTTLAMLKSQPNVGQLWWPNHQDLVFNKWEIHNDPYISIGINHTNNPPTPIVDAKIC